jgi:hypothetical protein
LKSKPYIKAIFIGKWKHIVRIRNDRQKDSEDPVIASYQNQTQQIKDMKWVLISAIVAGTLLMMIAIIFPFIVVTLLRTSLISQTNQTKMVDMIQTFSTVPRDVLPFATALAGFAGGVVTAMFRASTQPASTQPPAGGTGAGGTGAGGTGAGGTGAGGTGAGGTGAGGTGAGGAPIH